MIKNSVLFTSAAVKDAAVPWDEIRVTGQPGHHPEAGLFAKPNLAHIPMVLEVRELCLVALLPVALAKDIGRHCGGVFL
jgi:hypothetical protein